MTSLKQYIFYKFNTFCILLLLICGSLFLLMIRLKVTESFYLLFLVWNLFLAAVPFLISSFLSFKEQPKFSVLLLGILWLLFLPNAPYIVTDLIHLRNSPLPIIWYDFIMIIAFAITGLYLYYLSAVDMIQILKTELGKPAVNYFALLLPFLVGFGIYLGRYLRWNSWDILQNPSGLLEDIIAIFSNPIAHREAWIITIGFGILLMSWQFLLNKVLASKNKNTNYKSNSIENQISSF